MWGLLPLLILVIASQLHSDGYRGLVVEHLPREWKVANSAVNTLEYLILLWYCLNDKFWIFYTGSFMLFEDILSCWLKIYIKSVLQTNLTLKNHRVQKLRLCVNGKVHDCNKGCCKIVFPFPGIFTPTFVTKIRLKCHIYIFRKVNCSAFMLYY